MCGGSWFIEATCHETIACIAVEVAFPQAFTGRSILLIPVCPTVRVHPKTDEMFTLLTRVWANLPFLLDSARVYSSRDGMSRKKTRMKRTNLYLREKQMERLHQRAD